MSKSLLRIGDVVASLSLSRSAIYQSVALGTFPPQVRLGGSARWIAAEVRQWLDARIGGASDAELRELVKRLVAARKGGEAQ